MRHAVLTFLVSMLLVSSVAVAVADDAKRPPMFPVRVELDADGETEALLRELNLNVDAVFHDWARVYVVEEERDKLLLYGVTLSEIPDDAPQMAELARIQADVDPGPTPEGSVPAQYHTYDTLTADLQQIAADHAAIARLSSIGLTVQNRQLWMMKLSANPDVEEIEPEFLYISSMHGDEVVGKELLYNLIDYMIDNYGTDPRVTNLIDTTEIWILPSMNPDGTEIGQRANANNVDLNRDFPDQFIDPVNTTLGREPETAAVMNWRLTNYPALSANMHGGALVANYPFDSNPAGTSTFSPTPDPDHPTFVSVARTYADNNPPMSTSNSHPAFDDGITNGADWYSIHGGMQDWEYVWYGDFELTLEVSNVKWPVAADLPGFWDDNLESMLSYMERVHEDIRGTVTNEETGLPLAATVRVGGSDFGSTTDPAFGDYHRVVVPGTYDVTVSAPNHEEKVIPGVVVQAGPATVLDVQLGPQPVDLQPLSHDVMDGDDGRLTAGETTDIAVTLENLGRAATGVGADLVSIGYYGSVTHAWADYPDIGLGGSGESLAPHHGVTLDPATPAGHWAGFALSWTTDQGVGMSEAFFIDTGTNEVASQPSADVPQTIPTLPVPATIISQLPFSGITNIVDVRVTVDISHTYVGDLTVTLISPSSTRVVLHAKSGGTSDDIVGTYGVDLTPAQALSAFDGEDANGTWQLEIVDDALGGSGTLNAWSLEIEGRLTELTPPQMLFRSFESRPAGVRIEWWPYPELTSYRVYRSTDPSQAAAFVDVTAEDADPTDTVFDDASVAPLSYYLVTGVGSNGEGPKGHFGE